MDLWSVSWDHRHCHWPHTIAIVASSAGQASLRFHSIPRTILQSLPNRRQICGGLPKEETPFPYCIRKLSSKPLVEFLKTRKGKVWAELFHEEVFTAWGLSPERTFVFRKAAAQHFPCPKWSDLKIAAALKDPVLLGRFEIDEPDVWICGTCWEDITPFCR